MNTFLTWFGTTSNVLNMNSKYWTSKAMRTYGGSFVQALGVCLLSADDENTKRLETAFPEYFEKYSAMGLTMKAEDEQKP